MRRSKYNCFSRCSVFIFSGHEGTFVVAVVAVQSATWCVTQIGLCKASVKQTRKGTDNKPPAILAPNSMPWPVQGQRFNNTANKWIFVIVTAGACQVLTSVRTSQNCGQAQTSRNQGRKENWKVCKKEGRVFSAAHQTSSKGLPWHSMEILQRLRAVQLFAQRVAHEASRAISPRSPSESALATRFRRCSEPAPPKEGSRCSLVRS